MLFGNPSKFVSRGRFFYFSCASTKFSSADIKPRPNDRNMPTQHIATLLGATCCVRLATALQHVATCWVLLTIFKPEPTTPNMSQHIATRWPNVRNMLRPTVLRYVALTCCDRLAGALSHPIDDVEIWSRISDKRKEILGQSSLRLKATLPRYMYKVRFDLPGSPALFAPVQM